MSECDILLQIGTGAVGGAIAGLVAPAILIAIRDCQRRLERPKQIKVVRNHVIREFELLANAGGPPSERDSQSSNEFRRVFAPASWVRLLDTVEHLTGSLTTDERATLYGALHSCQAEQEMLKTLTIQRLWANYMLIAINNRWLTLPAKPRWSHPPEAPTANKTV